MAKDPRVKAIEARADEMSRDPASPGGAKSTPKERKGIRNTLRSRQGLGREEKVRGGVAGVLDRNEWLAPVLSAASAFIPGANALVPMAVGAAARGIQGGNVLQGGLEGAAYGGLGNAVQGAFSPAAPAPMAFNPSAPDVGPGIIPPTTASAGGFGGALSKAGDWLTANGGRNALGAAQTVNAAYQGMQARRMANRAVEGQEAEWRLNAPMRIEGRRRLMAGVPGNPFAAPLGVSP